MTLTVGIDSYISVADAETYFGNVLFADLWTSAVSTDKEKALRMATKKIDALMLIGRRVVDTQPLEFPRSLYSQTYGVWIDEEEFSREVKEATCEEALALIRGGTQATKRAELQRQGVMSFGLGPLSESYSGASSSPNKLISATAAQLLSRYVGGSRVIV